MYTAYFGLNENPFSIAPDPLYLYLSEHHREALAHLQYGLRSDGGFVLLTGEVGAGKTTLCRSLLEQLPEDVDVAYVLNPKVSAIELLETVCDELRIGRPERASVKQLVDRLNAYLLEANARGRRTVLIIDEAQNLAVDVLEQLRLLTNLETNRYKLLRIVLIGQPELLQILGRREMRQLSQRVTARCHLGVLDAGEIEAYVRHRLHIAGCDLPLFPGTPGRLLRRLTGGVPRLINLVCDRALLGAYVLGRREVDGRLLRQAAREALGEPQQGNPRPAWRLAAGLVVVLLAVLGGALWFLAPAYLSRLEQAAGGLAAAVQIRAPEPPPAAAAAVAPPTPAAPAVTAPEPEPEPEPPLPHAWPEGFAAGREMTSAFADLAGLWGLSYPADHPDLAAYAGRHGLSLMQRRDTLGALRNMNRPAVLTLYDDDGSPFHVVLARMLDDRALFIAGDTQQEVALPAISSRWFGEYLLLWEKPPLRQELLQPGERGDSVAWVAKALQDLGLYEATGREVRFDGALLGAFKRFQFNSGLTPDGVLGPLSMIHLNAARDLTGPHLRDGGAG